MPAKSAAQRITAAIAEHNPEKLYKRNKGMLSMEPGELHKMASTKERGLPMRAKATNFLRRKKREKRSY